MKCNEFVLALLEEVLWDPLDKFRIGVVFDHLFLDLLYTFDEHQLLVLVSAPVEVIGVLIQHAAVWVSRVCLFVPSFGHFSHSAVI